MAESQLLEFEIRILDVRLSRAMARLTAKRLVLSLSQLLEVVRMTFVARFSARKGDRPTGELRQGITPVPPILAETCRSQKGPGDHVSTYNDNG